MILVCCWLSAFVCHFRIYVSFSLLILCYNENYMHEIYSKRIIFFFYFQSLKIQPSGAHTPHILTSSHHILMTIEYSNVVKYPIDLVRGTWKTTSNQRLYTNNPKKNSTINSTTLTEHLLNRKFYFVIKISG